ncbi:hypothetical protein [Tepidibacter sp. Z1-5]|uniref:hypothetical protein n=1 Tax=Tepidibacter sp. Z1-5 TaxID=3134138 RepID=UPI0030C54F99
MDDIKIIEDKKYKKVNIQSMKIDGNDSDKIIRAKDVKNKDNIVIDIVVSKKENDKNNKK